MCLDKREREKAAHEGDSKQHARSFRPAAEATAGEAIDLDDLSTAAGAAPPPLAPTHGSAAETLHEGAEHDAETGNAVAAAAEAPVAADALGVRPPKPSYWGAMSGNQRKNWHMREGEWRRRDFRATAASQTFAL